MLLIRNYTFTELRLAQLELEQGHYLDLTTLLSLIPDPNQEKLWHIIHAHKELLLKAKGSSHNHQAWEGGYLEHVVETMNIACQQYHWMNKARKLPFELAEALEVMFLHDIEKPFKDHPEAMTPLGVTWAQYLEEASQKYWAAAQVKEEAKTAQQKSRHYVGEYYFDVKAARRQFRADMIKKYGILLSEEQENALRYVEGVPDSEYTPGERTMGELAAFCHCCDILSARMWWDRGHQIPAPAWGH